jgi:class 3 adenylate cyclase/DNA-binding beta-propeller fold protein YncE
VPRREPERALATVLFTDIVGSTELAARLGDRQWQELVRRHHRTVRNELKRHRGREIDTAGDGFFAIFDRPANAISCAVDIVASLLTLGIEIRAGIHVGEVELSGGKAGGIAVHTGARVLASARSGEILVTGTVKELVAGSDIEFADRGVAELKGVPGEWRLFAVVQRERPAGRISSPTLLDGRETAEDRGRVISLRTAVVGIAGVAILGATAAVLLPRLWAAPLVVEAGTVGHIAAGADGFDRAVRVGSQPTGLAFGSDAVWVLNFRDATISKIDAASGEVLAAPAVGGTPTGIAFGADAVWVSTGFGEASGTIGSIAQFDARQASVELRVEIGSGVSSLAFGEGALWVVDRTRELVLKLDPADPMAAPVEIPVGAGPQAIAVGAGSVWVTSTIDDTLLRIDAHTYETLATIALIDTPTAVAVGDGAVWVTSEAGDNVTRIDPETNRPATTIEVGNGPLGLATTPGWLWVAVGGGGHVAKLNPGSDTVVMRYEVHGAPDGIVADDAGGIWVSVHAP